MMMKLKNWGLLSVAFVMTIGLLMGCTPKDNALMEEGPMNTNEAEVEPTDEERVERLSLQVLVALKGEKLELVADMAHREGVLFSPYTHVDTEKDQVLTSDELRGAMEDEQVRLWGNYDGSGEPIELTFAEYYKQFVFDHDYTEADETALDRTIGQGNTLNNIKEVFPEAHVMEYHFKGFDPEVEGMDWTSLRLVFTEDEGDWRLRAIVHDQWTI